MPDKFAATWVSHTSMSDFLKCPRAYYLNNVYKDPQSNHKIQIIGPALSLGSAVHEVLESLSVLSTTERFKRPLLDRFQESWKKVTGKKGGFLDKDQEQQYKQRGEKMIKAVQSEPGPLKNLAVKIKADLPHYWLSEEDEILLCGKIDWLEYIPSEDAVHIIDFKTGKQQESDDSLQLPIYHLLVCNTQQRDVAKASYWYLENNSLLEKELPNLQEAHNKVLEVAKKVKTARKLGHFKCSNGSEGCFACRPLEKVLAGQAEFVGVSEYGQDMYVLPEESSQISKESEIL